MNTANTSNPYNLDELFMTLSITDIKQAIREKHNENNSQWLECAKDLVSESIWVECLPKNKTRVKVQGIKASYQSDKECSYVHVQVTKENDLINSVLNKLEEIMTSEDWGYYCAECIEGEGAIFFGDNEKTIKQMKDDYKTALKLALN
tara:strand:+ start:111 stop:554 length:444 start_codon:yes stop_codon:yes gene_type:complete